MSEDCCTAPVHVWRSVLPRKKLPYLVLAFRLGCTQQLGLFARQFKLCAQCVKGRGGRGKSISNLLTFVLIKFLNRAFHLAPFPSGSLPCAHARRQQPPRRVRCQTAGRSGSREPIGGTETEKGPRYVICSSATWLEPSVPQPYPSGRASKSPCVPVAVRNLRQRTAGKLGEREMTMIKDAAPGVPVVAPL